MLICFSVVLERFQKVLKCFSFSRQVSSWFQGWNNCTSTQSDVLLNKLQQVLQQLMQGWPRPPNQHFSFFWHYAVQNCTMMFKWNWVTVLMSQFWSPSSRMDQGASDFPKLPLTWNKKKTLWQDRYARKQTCMLLQVLPVTHKLEIPSLVRFWAPINTKPPKQFSDLHKTTTNNASTLLLTLFDKIPVGGQKQTFKELFQNNHTNEFGYY